MPLPPSLSENNETLSNGNGLWSRLKDETRNVHGRLDSRIMEARPFESVDRYGRFVLMQRDFHAHVSPLYQNLELAALLPGLTLCDRMEKIEKDLEDLGINEADRSTSEQLEFDLPTALGWLYVAEGSNLGAAFLLKAAQKLGLSEKYGARHFDAAPEGRARHWKSFTTALDAIPLAKDEEDRVISGAIKAFAVVRGLVETRFFRVAAG